MPFLDGLFVFLSAERGAELRGFLIVARAACGKQKPQQLKRFVLAPRARAKRLSLLSSAFMATQSP